MKTTDYFQCDRCSIECRLESERPGPIGSKGTAPLTIRHCPDSTGIVVFGKVTASKNDGAVGGCPFSVGLMQPKAAYDFPRVSPALKTGGVL